MVMPAKATSTLKTSAISHGPAAGVTHAAGPDALLKLAGDGKALESSLNFWGTFLVVASIVVAIGVILESLEELCEILESIRLNRPILRQKMVVFLGAMLVIFGVIGEFCAEYGSGDVETKLRANNAAVQGVLDARARSATRSAVDLTTKFGGLQNFVDIQKRQIDGNMGDLRDFADTEKRKTDTVIGELNKDRVDLDRARMEAQAAAAEAVRQLEAMKMQDAPRTLNSDRQNSVAVATAPYAGQRYKVAISAAADDGPAFWKSLYAALERAGWTYVPPAGPPTVAVPPAGIPITAVPGIEILFDPDNELQMKLPALALGNSLHADGTVVAVNRDDKGGRIESDRDVITIRIGARVPPP